MTARPLISIVSPVYRCKEYLAELSTLINKTLEVSGLDWEVILVDDRSPDNSWPLIQELAASDKRIKGIRLARNYGQHLAIWAGLEKARGDWVAVIDCDLQDDPSIIPTLYETAVAQNVEALIVDRGQWSESRIRSFLGRLFYRLLSAISGINVEFGTGNFGLYSRFMVNVLLSYREKEVFLPMLVTHTGLSKEYFTLDRSDRQGSKSSYTFVRLMRLAMAIIITFSDRPLKLGLIIGLSFCCLSAIVTLMLLVGWSFGAFTVAGWASTFLSIWFFSGLILLFLGIHGFYLGRVLGEVRQRPRTLVQDSVNITEP